MNNTTKYEKGFTYYDSRGVKITLLEWIKIDAPSIFGEQYRWRIKCEFLGVETLAWTDDCWIDVHTGKAFVNEQTHKIVYYDEIDIIPKSKPMYQEPKIHDDAKKLLEKLNLLVYQEKDVMLIEDWYNVFDSIRAQAKVIEQPLDVFGDMRKIGLSSDQCSEVSDYVEKHFRQR